MARLADGWKVVSYPPLNQRGFRTLVFSPEKDGSRQRRRTIVSSADAGNSLKEALLLFSIAHFHRKSEALGTMQKKKAEQRQSYIALKRGVKKKRLVTQGISWGWGWWAEKAKASKVFPGGRKG